MSKTNPTKVNDKDIYDTVALHNGDCISIAEREFIFREGLLSCIYTILNYLEINIMPIVVNSADNDDKTVIFGKGLVSHDVSRTNQIAKSCSDSNSIETPSKLEKSRLTPIVAMKTPLRLAIQARRQSFNNLKGSGSNLESSMMVKQGTPRLKEVSAPSKTLRNSLKKAIEARRRDSSIFNSADSLSSLFKEICDNRTNVSKILLAASVDNKRQVVSTHSTIVFVLSLTSFRKLNPLLTLATKHLVQIQVMSL